MFSLERPELGVDWYRFAVCAAERGPKPETTTFTGGSSGSIAAANFVHSATPKPVARLRPDEPPITTGLPVTGEPMNIPAAVL